MTPRTALDSARLHLEPVATRHAEGLYHAALASQAQLLPWMPWAAEITLESNRNYTTEAQRCWQADEEYHFAIMERDLVLGVIGLNRGPSRTAELHYWLRSDRTGRGYATEAGVVVLQWGADVLRLESFTLWSGIDNHASRRVAEKLGFRDLGPLPEPMSGGRGTFLADGYERSAAAPDLRMR